MVNEQTLILRKPFPETNDLFYERFVAARREKECCYEKTNQQKIIMRAKDYRPTMTSGWQGVARGEIFKEVRPGVDFEPGDFVKET